MKLEEINRTIAEKCGWRIEQCGATWMLRKPPEDRVVSSGHRADHDIKTIADYQKAFSVKNCLPDYYHDLNAVHEAVNSLDLTSRCDWILWMDRLTVDPDDKLDQAWFPHRFLKAGPDKWCEALLRTLGLWEEVEE